MWWKLLGLVASIGLFISAISEETGAMSKSSACLFSARNLDERHRIAWLLQVIRALDYFKLDTIRTTPPHLLRQSLESLWGGRASDQDLDSLLSEMHRSHPAHPDRIKALREKLGFLPAPQPLSN